MVVGRADDPATGLDDRPQCRPIIPTPLVVFEPSGDARVASVGVGGLAQHLPATEVAFEVEGERTTYKWVEAAPNDGGFRASWDEARLRERYEGREIDDLTIETNGTHGILQGTIDTSVIESFD